MQMPLRGEAEEGKIGELRKIEVAKLEKTGELEGREQ
jgi:hypothetical protein